MTPPKPVILCILDGWGLSDVREGNAVALAQTPNFDRVMAECAHAKLTTHGPDVGLPAGQMGNSEVGHTNIGAGRVVAMDLGQIDLAIEDKSFFQNQALQSWISALKEKGGAAHIMGVISDGGVHGHLNHMIAAVKACTDAGLKVHIHAITDGRDVAPVSALGYLETLESALPNSAPKLAQIATISGRYYALDRDHRWERIEPYFQAVTQAKAPHFVTAVDAIEAGYAADLTDEFILPARIGEYQGARDGDGLFCLNFRADRARQIMAAMGDPSFEAFDITGRPNWSGLLGMADYSKAHQAYMLTAYPKAEIVNTLGEWVAKQGLKQFRLAETEKYPHVTFFLNGGREASVPGEDRAMPKSPKVATYDLQPEMSSVEVTERLLDAIDAAYDLIVVNYANPDMVGHTGDLPAAIAACEAVDTGLGHVLARLEEVGGAMLLTADHGNCEVMIDPETGAPHTAHTTNLVPVVLIGAQGALSDGRLADLAPTVLGLMNLDVPKEMTGKNLIS